MPDKLPTLEEYSRQAFSVDPNIVALPGSIHPTLLQVGAQLRIASALEAQTAILQRLHPEPQVATVVAPESLVDKSTIRLHVAVSKYQETAFRQLLADPFRADYVKLDSDYADTSTTPNHHFILQATSAEAIFDFGHAWALTKEGGQADG